MERNMRKTKIGKVVSNIVLPLTPLGLPVKPSTIDKVEVSFITTASYPSGHSPSGTNKSLKLFTIERLAVALPTEF